ncbi:hypothetical protein [Mesorhizobium sp. NZP2077]|uniref:hypothetical protein n=1 Tax=Mesorhizobium sp. NZP2077 TaxID=2483404 RepID=UPI001AEDBBCA|nr:hypothetical protein [Mesorhizobium sp. NZP2077]
MAKGIPVFSLLSDFAAGVREDYIGLINRKVGGQPLGCFQDRKNGPARWRSSSAATASKGTSSTQSAFAPISVIKVLDMLVNLEKRQITYQITLDLMRRNLSSSGHQGLREEGSRRA